MVTTNGSGLNHSARVYQAQGIVSVQADCAMDEALRLMKLRAHDIDRTLDEIAAGVVGHRIWFRHDPHT